jgi:hypothetical protein
VYIPVVTADALGFATETVDIRTANFGVTSLRMVYLVKRETEKEKKF